MSPITTSPSPIEAQLQAFAAALERSIARVLPNAPPQPVVFESPRRPEFGDFATNAAFALAKHARKAPLALTTELLADLRVHEATVADQFAMIEVRAGFINLRLAPAVWRNVLAEILARGDSYGQQPSNGQRISLEFGSANPTGPLVVVQGRALSVGDALARAMRLCGYHVFVEWIINDAGRQVEMLGRSIYARYCQTFDTNAAFPEDGYPGAYLLPIAQSIAETDGRRWLDAQEGLWLPHFTTVGRNELVEQQQRSVANFGVVYDLWQSEKELHENGHVTTAVQRLVDAGATYVADGATYFRATEFGDDKDRVMVRSDGRPTYFAPDVAYHFDKLQRADHVIDILGPDHHGYIGRLAGLATALGYEGKLEVVIAQHVTLVRNGETVSSSKRAGEIITLDEVVNEVGVDAARFFFTMLSPEQPLKFDLSLALEKSNENPVFYVQYGHARIASILRNAHQDDIVATATDPLTALESPAEIGLIRRLADFSRTVQAAVEHRAPHRIAHYAREVAGDFHAFYAESKILCDDRPTRIARLALAIATKRVLGTALGLLGVSAPELMEREVAPEPPPESPHR